MSQKFKTAVIWLYSAVIIVIGVSLFWMLQSRPTDTEEQTRQPADVDQDVLAVLAEIEENTSVTVPVAEIDALLPKRVRPSWERFAATMTDSTGPHIAIVIDDLGLSVEATERLAVMQGPYTLAYLPYAEGLPAQTRLVRDAGHELMVHLPMEPKGAGADPGDNALLLDLPEAEFERRIKWNLQQFEGYVGINNHMGSRLTEAAGPMVRVMMHLKQEGFLFLDSLTSPNSVGISAARATGVPFLSRDVFLDNIQQEDYILRQLEKAEKVAHMRGYAIAIGHPYPVTLDTLDEWQRTLGDKGLSLVPISQILRDRVMSEQKHAASAKTPMPADR